MLRDVLEKDVSIKKLTRSKIAGIAGTSVSTISRFLYGDGMNFEYALRIVKSLYPEKELEIMRKYSIDQDLANARIALDYCFTNRLLDEVEILIEKLRNGGNRIDNEWGSSYNLLLKLDKEKEKKNSADFGTIVKEAFRLRTNTKSLEMRVLLRLTELYALYYSKNYEEMLRIADNIFDEINEIEEGVVKDNYRIKAAIALGMISVYNDDPETARKYADMCLRSDISGDRLSSVYYIKSLSYIYSDKEKCIEYIIKSMESAKSEIFYTDAKMTLTFIQNLYGEEPTYLDEDSQDIRDYHEVVHYYIRNGDKAKASELLEKIDVQNICDYSKPFYYYFKGLITENADDFYKSTLAFKKYGSKLYRKLPLIELKKFGVNEIALEIMAL